MTDFDFYKKYTLDETVKSTVFKSSESEKGILDTSGDDLDLALEIANLDPDRVWTMVDSDDGMYLVQGLKLSNRVYFVVTTERAESLDEQYLFDLHEEDEAF